LLIEEKESNNNKTAAIFGRPTNERLYGKRSKLQYDVGPLRLEVIYDLVVYIRDNVKPVTPKHLRRKHAFSGRGKSSLYPGRGTGERGQPTFEDYDCVTSASQIGKSFGCLSARKIHSRIEFLGKCGILEYETYKPKYRKRNMKEKPYWYTKLAITEEKGKRFIELYAYLSSALHSY
jgi:hypothetical protein